MLFDIIFEKIKSMEAAIEIIQTFLKNAQIEEQIQTLEKITETISDWQDQKQIASLKKLQSLRHQKEIHQQLIVRYTEFKELLELFKDDEIELEKLLIESRQLHKAIINFKIELLLHEEQDNTACFFNISPGAGGTESQDWAEMLLRMYIRFCEQNNFDCSILDYQTGEGAGIKGATLFIKGKNAFGMLKSERGVHRLVRISPYDANKRRHTSFVSVHIVPELEKSDIVIQPEDLRIDTYRSGGAGGQHVNKTESAIRITHLPTGIVTQCQNERSQGQNKETALKMLKAKLAQKQEEEMQAKNASIEKKKVEWGSQIRSYVLHPYKMVKDHRTDYESQQPDLVLDGDLIGFIEAYLLQKN